MKNGSPGTVMQVAYLVRDLDAAIDTWARDLRAGPFYKARFQLEEQIYRGQTTHLDVTVAIGYMGTTNIELVCPNDDGPSVFNEVLQARGEGLHHYWLATDDMNAEMARYEATGCPVIACGEAPGFTRSAFVDTSRQLGCYVELQELTPRVWELLGEMQAVHASWDGKDPIREYPAL